MLIGTSRTLAYMTPTTRDHACEGSEVLPNQYQALRAPYGCGCLTSAISTVKDSAPKAPCTSVCGKPYNMDLTTQVAHCWHGM